MRVLPQGISISKSIFCLLWAKTHNKMKRKNIYVAAGLGLVQLALTDARLYAQSQKPSSLNEVVVTASRSPKKISDIGKMVRVISREEIERSQGRTLPELLNTVPGLNVTGSGSALGEVKSVYLRGASSANTLILIDGIPVNDASGISGEYNLAAIAIDQIERVEILKGASSTLYGSDAVAGVINIITKKGEGKLKTNALLSGGTYNTYKQAVGLNGHINKTAVALNFSNLDSKGFSSAQPLNAASSFEKDKFSQQGLSLNLSQYLNSTIKVLGGLQLNNNKSGLDGGAFQDNTNYNYNKVALLGNIGLNVALRKGNLSLIASQNNVSNKFNNNGANSYYKGSITNIEGILSYKLNNFLDLTSGANYKYSATDQFSGFGAPLTAGNANNNIASLFTSLFFNVNEVFRMEIGGRYNNHSAFGDNFTYTLNPSVLLFNSFKIYGNISSAFRVPSLYQLTSIYANPAGLNPETSFNYEAGFSTDLFQNKLNINTSVFFREIDDVIDFGSRAGGGFGYLNQNQQNDEGIETEIGFKPHEKLSINAFYAYVYGRVIKSPGTPGAFNLSRRPVNSSGANISYYANKNLSFSVLYKWTDSRRDIYYDTGFNEQNVVLSSYHKFDAYVQYKTKKNVTLFADVKNLFDARYNDFAGYNTMGTNFNAGISFLFQ
jgi:vitamin B12 transporter